MKNLWLQFVGVRAGATSIEYALLACLVAVIAIVGVQTLGSKVNTNFQFINNAIN